MRVLVTLVSAITLTSMLDAQRLCCCERTLPTQACLNATAKECARFSKRTWRPGFDCVGNSCRTKLKSKNMGGASIEGTGTSAALGVLPFQTSLKLGSKFSATVSPPRVFSGQTIARTPIRFALAGAVGLRFSATATTSLLRVQITDTSSLQLPKFKVGNTSVGVQSMRILSQDLMLDLTRKTINVEGNLLVRYEVGFGAATVPLDEEACIAATYDTKSGQWSLVRSATEFHSSLASTFGDGCSGSNNLAPAMDLDSIPTIPNPDFAIVLFHGRPNSTAVVLLSTSREKFSIGSCDVVARTLFLTVPVLTNSEGFARVGLPIGRHSRLFGASVVATAVVVDPNGSLLGTLSVADALEIRLGWR